MMIVRFLGIQKVRKNKQSVYRSPACEGSYVDLDGLNRCKGVTHSQIRVIHPQITNTCLHGAHIQQGQWGIFHSTNSLMASCPVII
jgi:hypothetical protein